jgi:hypothetical protein
MTCNTTMDTKAVEPGCVVSRSDAERQKSPDLLYWLWGTVTTVALCELLPDWSVHVTVMV